MRRKLWWLGIAVLALALVGQYVVYRYGNTTHALNAAWADRSTSFNQVLDNSSDVVQAQVQGVERGPDLVFKAPAEPNGEIRIPTQNITLVVQNASKGNAKGGQTIHVFRTGGDVNLPASPASTGNPPPQNLLRAKSPFGPTKPDAGVKAPAFPDLPAAAPGTPNTATNTNISEELDDDPPYAVGQVYFLALTDGPNGLKRPVSPSGRYMVTGSNTLQPVSGDDVAQSVAGRPVSDAAAAARGQLVIPPKSQVQKRVTTPGMPTTGIPTDNLLVWIAVAVALVAVVAGMVMRRRRT